MMKYRLHRISVYIIYLVTSFFSIVCSSFKLDRVYFCYQILPESRFFICDHFCRLLKNCSSRNLCKSRQFAQNTISPHFLYLHNNKRNALNKNLMFSASTVATGMTGSAGTFHVGIEACLLVGGVVDRTKSSIGFVNCVMALHFVTVSYLVLGVLVAGVAISNAIFEAVPGMRLKKWCYTGTGRRQRKRIV